MSKFLAIVTICALVAFVSALKYDLQVSCGPQQFERKNVTLNVVLHTASKQRQTLFNWNSTVNSNTNHTKSVDYVYQIGQIKNVTFSWNATQRTSGEQYVYVRHVKIVPTYYPTGRYRDVNTRFWCLPASRVNTPVRPNESLNLVQC